VRVTAHNDNASDDALAQLCDLLRNGMAKKAWNVTTLAGQAGLSRTTVTNALNASTRPPSEARPPSAMTVALLAEKLGLDMDSLLALQRAAVARVPGSSARYGRGRRLTAAEDEQFYEGPWEAAAAVGRFMNLLDRACRERNALSGLLERLLRRTSELGGFDARVMHALRRRLAAVGLQPALLIPAMPQHDATLNRWLRWEDIEDGVEDGGYDQEQRAVPQVALRAALAAFTTALVEALTSDREIDDLLAAGGMSLVVALTGRGALAAAFLAGLDHRSRLGVMRSVPFPREQAESDGSAEPRPDEAEREHHRALQATAAWVYRLRDRDEPLKGRDELIAEVVHKVAERMRTQGSATAFLSGQPGVGASTVAVEAARLLARDFRDVVYVDLHGLNPDRRVDAHAAARLVSTALRLDMGGSGGAEDDVFAQLGERLAGRRALLIFDNAADAAHIAPLARAKAGCAVIVTSRDRAQGFATPGLVFHVEALPTPDAVDVLEHYAAGPSHSRLELLERVARLCDGLPLALRLAGERIAALSDRDLELFATRLQDELTRLDYLQVGERALRAMIALSYDRLDPEARRACRLLTVLPAATTSGEEFSHCIDSVPALGELALSRLVDRSLACETPQVHGDGAAFAAFSLYEMVRLFAQERLRDEEPADSLAKVRQRCVVFLNERLQQIVERGREADLAAELDPVRFYAAEKMAEECGWHDLAAQLAERLYALHTSRRDVHAMVLAHDLRLGLLLRARQHDAGIQLCFDHAGRVRALKSTARALDSARQALRISRDRWLPDRTAEAYLLISLLHADERDWSSALDAGERAARTLQRLRLPQAEVKVLINNARCAIEGHFPEKALHWAQRAADGADAFGDPAERRSAYNDCGRACFIAGDYPGSIAAARRAVTLCAVDQSWLDAAVAASNGALAAAADADTAAETELRRMSTEYWQRAAVADGAYGPYFVQAMVDLSAAETRAGSAGPAVATLRRAAGAAAENTFALPTQLRSEVLVRLAAAERLAAAPNAALPRQPPPDLTSPTWNQSARGLDPRLTKIRDLLIRDASAISSGTTRGLLSSLLSQSTLHVPQPWDMWMHEDLGDLSDYYREGEPSSDDPFDAPD
jgi:transcriptional regulator with XRE-family HTH domain